ncbi:MAG: hypothetical protein AAF264_05565 [Pseudomonadota bacterium]
MPTDRSTGHALLALRLTLFLFMLMWALVKVLNPASYGGTEEGPGIFGTFYGIDFGTGAVLIIGVAQVAFLLAFVAGIAKTVTTGGVLAMNLVTLIASLPTILPALAGGGNLLFAASIPVFGASLALFLMRERDVVLSYGGRREATPGT